MIYSQGNKHIDYPFQFIIYKDKETDGFNRKSRTFRSVNDRNSDRYFSFYLELVYA